MKDYGKIAVLAGGPSSEREISLKSGSAVFRALKKMYRDVYFVEMGKGPASLPVGPDFDTVFIALHGKFGEDGSVQSELERRGIAYTGSGVSASRLARVVFACIPSSPRLIAAWLIPAAAMAVATPPSAFFSPLKPRSADFAACSVLDRDFPALSIPAENFPASSLRLTTRLASVAMSFIPAAIRGIDHLYDFQHICR